MSMQRGRRMHASKLITAAVRSLLVWMAVAGFAGWLAPPAQAQQREMELSLREATAFALQGNLNIQIAGLEPRIREAQVAAEESIFDVQLHASATASNSRLLSTSPFFQEFINESVAQDNTQEQSVGFGLSRLNPWGGTYGVELLENRVDSTRRVPFPPDTPPERQPPLRNVFNTAELQLKLSQPLLKNFGSAVTNNRIVVAQNNLAMSRQGFGGRVIAVTSQVQQAYWDLVFRRQDLEVRRQQRALAEQLLDQIRKQVAVGTLAPIEVLQAETEIARVEEGILVAENTLRATEDQLKRIMNFSLLGELADVVLLPVDTPAYDARTLDQEDQIRQALEHRGDLVQAKLALENQRVTLVFSENQALPILDLETSLRINGISKNFRDQFDEFDPGKRYRWDVSLQFSQPLGNPAGQEPGCAIPAGHPPADAAHQGPGRGDHPAGARRRARRDDPCPARAGVARVEPAGAKTARGRGEKAAGRPVDRVHGAGFPGGSERRTLEGNQCPDRLPASPRSSRSRQRHAHGVLRHHPATGRPAPAVTARPG